MRILLFACNSWISEREENDRRNWFMINLHESMGSGRDQTRDPWICSQKCYRLRYKRGFWVCPCKFITTGPHPTKSLTEHFGLGFWIKHSLHADTRQLWKHPRLTFGKMHLVLSEEWLKCKTKGKQQFSKMAVIWPYLITDHNKNCA